MFQRAPGVAGYFWGYLWGYFRTPHTTTRRIIKRLQPDFGGSWAHQFSTAMPAFERALLFLAATKRLAVTIWYYSSRSSRSLLYEHFERARLAQPGNHHNPQSTGGH